MINPSTLKKEPAMKFNMPMAVFGGLTLIAAAIYFGSGSQPVNAAGGVQKIALCNGNRSACADVFVSRGDSYMGVAIAQ